MGGPGLRGWRKRDGDFTSARNSAWICWPHCARMNPAGSTSFSAVPKSTPNAQRRLHEVFLSQGGSLKRRRDLGVLGARCLGLGRMRDSREGRVNTPPGRSSADCPGIQIPHPRRTRREQLQSREGRHWRIGPPMLAARVWRKRGAHGWMTGRARMPVCMFPSWAARMSNANWACGDGMSGPISPEVAQSGSLVLPFSFLFIHSLSISKFDSSNEFEWLVWTEDFQISNKMILFLFCNDYFLFIVILIIYYTFFNPMAPNLFSALNLNLRQDLFYS
jgi:hypothetical protein